MDEDEEYVFCRFLDGPADGRLMPLPVDVTFVSIAEPMQLIYAPEPTDEIVMIAHLYLLEGRAEGYRIFRHEP